MASQATAETLGLKPIPEFDGVFDIWPRGDRLKAIRAAAEEFKRRFKEQGQVIAVRSIDLAAAPYLT